MIMILTVSVFFLYFSCLPMLTSLSVTLSYPFCFIVWLSVCLSVCLYVCHFFVVLIFLSVNLSFSDISLSVHLPDILLSLVHSIRSARVYDSPAPTCSFPT